MKRLLILLAMLGAAFAVLSATALGGGPVRSTSCTTDMGGQPFTTNLDVPAGATCRLSGGSVSGNVSVEGTLFTFGYSFSQNVTVTGGSFCNVNYPLHITGNLAITGSSGPSNGPCEQNGNFAVYGDGSSIGGNFSYTGNSGRLYIAGDAGGTVLSGNFTFNTNTGGYDIGGLHVLGHSNIS